MESSSLISAFDEEPPLISNESQQLIQSNERIVAAGELTPRNQIAPKAVEEIEQINTSSNQGKIDNNDDITRFIEEKKQTFAQLNQSNNFYN